MGRCEDCRADGAYGSCEELFHALLALDHQRAEPWGPLHGAAVACFFLQHPSLAAPRTADGQWQLLLIFLDGGLEAMQEETTARVARNRRGNFDPHDAPPAPPRRRHGAFTIQDLGVDGTFPAEGYAQRMTAWASAIRDERSMEQ